MKTNTWIKRSANNVMWTLFVVVFLSHSYTSEIFDSIGSEWIKFEIRVLLRTKIDIKANLHLLYLSVCTRLLVLYVVWMTVWCVRWKYVWELVITAEDFPPCDSFSIQYTFVVDLFCLFFSFCLSKIYSDVNCY